MPFPYIGELEDLEYYREQNDDTFSDVEAIMAIKRPEDIKSLEIVDIYEDDHEVCADVIMNGEIEFGACWITHEFLADLIYAAKGTESAKVEVYDYIKYFQDEYRKSH